MSRFVIESTPALLYFLWFFFCDMQSEKVITKGVYVRPCWCAKWQVKKNKGSIEDKWKRIEVVSSIRGPSVSSHGRRRRRTSRSRVIEPYAPHRTRVHTCKRSMEKSCVGASWSLDASVKIPSVGKECTRVWCDMGVRVQRKDPKAGTEGNPGPPPVTVTGW